MDRMPATLDELVEGFLIELPDKCPICWESFDEARRAVQATSNPRCRHIFCRPCLLNWLRSDLLNTHTCPLCTNVLYKPVILARPAPPIALVAPLPPLAPLSIIACFTAAAAIVLRWYRALANFWRDFLREGRTVIARVIANTHLRDFWILPYLMPIALIVLVYPPFVHTIYRILITVEISMVIYLIAILRRYPGVFRMILILLIVVCLVHIVFLGQHPLSRPYCWVKLHSADGWTLPLWDPIGQGLLVQALSRWGPVHAVRLPGDPLGGWCTLHDISLLARHGQLGRYFNVPLERDIDFVLGWQIRNIYAFLDALLG